MLIKSSPFLSEHTLLYVFFLHFTAKTCKVYVDENARVYQDWNSYLTNNTLPKCVIIAPEDGEYEGVIQEVLLILL